MKYRRGGRLQLKNNLASSLSFGSQLSNERSDARTFSASLCLSKVIEKDEAHSELEIYILSVLRVHRVDIENGCRHLKADVCALTCLHMHAQAKIFLRLLTYRPFFVCTRSQCAMSPIVIPLNASVQMFSTKKHFVAKLM